LQILIQSITINVNM